MLLQISFCTLPIRPEVANVGLPWLIHRRHVNPVLIEVFGFRLLAIAPSLTDHAEEKLQMTTQVNGNFSHTLNMRGKRNCEPCRGDQSYIKFDFMKPVGDITSSPSFATLSQKSFRLRVAPGVPQKDTLSRVSFL